MSDKALTLFDPALLRPAFIDAVKKLDPRVQWRNPVMFVVYVGSAVTTAMAVAQPSLFNVTVALWLWFTVLFANFAEALAEGRSKAQVLRHPGPSRCRGPAADARLRHLL